MLSVSGLLLVLCLTVHAERLPIKTYTTADGLAHNTVNRVVRDRRGFLWFCTDEGLSRFDGYSFTNYGVAEGLPDAVVSDILETGDGDYWVATNGGLCKFNPRGLPVRFLSDNNSTPESLQQNAMFTVFTPPGNGHVPRAMKTLLESRDGTIWCGAVNGLFRLSRTTNGFQLASVDIGLAAAYAEQSYVNALLEDRHGTLWIGTPVGLYRRWSDGSAARYGKSAGLPDEYIYCLLEDHLGDLWVGTAHGALLRMTIGEGHNPPVITHSYNRKNGFSANWVFALHEAPDDVLWVGTNRGLNEFSLKELKATGPLHAYTESSGLSFHEVVSVTEDRDGNLWLGTNIAGAMKLARNGFSAFDETDGLNYAFSFFEDRAGAFYAYAEVLGDQRASVFDGARLDLVNRGTVNYWRRLGRFDGQRFTWLIPDVLKKEYLGWSDRTLALQAPSGGWWFGTGSGLYLFPPTATFRALKTALPTAVYTTKDGLATLDVFCIYEDLQGNLWVATASASGDNGLARWDRATRQLRDVSHTEGLPSLKDRLPTAFEEDLSGNLWVGFNRGELARYQGGRFTVFTNSDGLPAGRINDLYLARDGKLWIATQGGGLSRVDRPGDGHPSFINYSTAQGLSSNSVSALTEDLYGRIYAGTGQGLDRLNPMTGRIKHYTTADGLAPGGINNAFRDHNGWLWFGTAQGLSRFLPEPEQSLRTPPPILIDGLRVAGARQQVSAIGETAITLADIPAGANQLQIDFLGLSFAPGESLHYQMMLEGADPDWGAPATLRTVNYANIAPGHYRFLVRAVTANGIASPVPATVSFTVLAPVWQRWWFLALGSLLTLTVGYALYRYRVARLVEVANMRTRIATDLHDDIGSGLSRMAILSEVVKQQMGTTLETSGPLLTEIADSARVLVASMRDIVWSIDPRRDDLSSVIFRLRQFASDVLEPQEIKLDFQVPPEAEKVKITPEQRRHIFLIFKEAINNAARHSECASISLTTVISHGRLTMEIRDDGRGLADAGDAHAHNNGHEVGHGMENMQSRAAQIGGSFIVDSAPHCGTALKLIIPL